MTPAEAIYAWKCLYSHLSINDLDVDVVLWKDETYLRSINKIISPEIRAVYFEMLAVEQAAEYDWHLPYYTPVLLKTNEADIDTVMLTRKIPDQVHLIDCHVSGLKAFWVDRSREPAMGLMAILIQDGIPVFIMVSEEGPEIRAECCPDTGMHYYPLQILAAMLDFLESPYVSLSESKPGTRQQRRALERKGQIAPMVRTVTLRKALPSGSPGHVDREYSCQWEVSGHWRQTKHRLVYVRPHIKGPEGKPLKPKLPTVYVAAR